MEIIKCVDLTKKFGDFTANKKINLSVQENEIKAIVGENGAGKSTLMNMLYGLLEPTDGHIEVGGKRVAFSSPTDAIAASIGMVHQHFKLVPRLRVYENVLLGAEVCSSFKLFGRKVSLPFLSRRLAKERISQLIERFGFDLEADALVQNISVGAKQKVEILKMLYRDVDILIFDEPTAVLTPQEIEEFFESLRYLKGQGKTIIIITHKLGEVMEISDSVTVIKQGEVVKSLATCDTNEKELAQLMVGRDVLLTVESEQYDSSGNDLVYEVSGLSTENDEGRKVVDDISFSIREGEILGIAGVEGNGQTELLKLLTGLMCSTEGSVRLWGKDITNVWPRELRDRHIGIIPEERYIQGLCKDMTLSQNCIAGYHHQADFCRKGLLHKELMDQRRDQLIKHYDIRISDGDANISSLSGGNAQKIIIGREFESNPDLLIAAQPTRGVDIGAIEFIHSSILSLRKRKKAVLLVSTELSEIMSLSDRIIVMYKGRIIGEVDAKNTSRGELGLLMAGVQNGE